MIIDATCAPADIAYPTDLELCGKARSWTERIIDRYWRMYGSASGKKTKPRIYRKVARHRFLNVNKRRTKSAKKIRKELRYQLKCINRNLRHIEEYENEHCHEGLLEVEKERIIPYARSINSRSSCWMRKNAQSRTGL